MMKVDVSVVLLMLVCVVFCVNCRDTVRASHCASRYTLMHELNDTQIRCRITGIDENDRTATLKWLRSGLGQGTGQDLARFVPELEHCIRHGSLEAQYWALLLLGTIGKQASSANDAIVNIIEREVRSNPEQSELEALEALGPGYVLRASDDPTARFRSHVKWEEKSDRSKALTVRKLAESAYEQINGVPYKFSE